MRIASNEYKQAMSKLIRNRGYASVGIGVVNQEAQNNGTVSGIVAEWCNKESIFDSTKNDSVDYVTLEQNFFKTDGSMIFMPEGNIQKKTQAAISKDTMSGIRIKFPKEYTVKGMTINFGEYYPTEFMIMFDNKIYEYVNNSPEFTTTELFENVKYFDIYPREFVGGRKRLRIYEITMGAGLKFSNAEIKDLVVNDYVSSISEELPRESLSMTIFDKYNRFNVDDDNSYIQFLQSRQRVSLSFGVELDSGLKEWVDYATLYLTDWDSYKGILTIGAEDRISSMEDEYSDGNKIYERTAYEEAVSILSSAGVESGEYVLDEYLKDVVLVNPMPVSSQRECLQLLANACRCKLYQDSHGKIVIKANFASSLSPSEMSVETNGVADWSKPQNVLYGSSIVYADLTKDFFRADGFMYFIPEDSNYLETAYISEQISNENGEFSNNPLITIKLPAAYKYNNVNVRFGGAIPKSLIVRTYADGTVLDVVEFDSLSANSLLQYEYSEFDEISIEVVKTNPYSRVLIDQISFGDFSDFVLTKEMMLEQPHGYVEKKTRSIRVKVFSYELNDSNEPVEIENNVYVENVLNENGTIKYCENPLVATREHAQLLAEWMGNYYQNNISYEVSYRGEPRIEASDIFKMESDHIENLEVEVEEQTFNFNGAFNGSLSLRRSTRTVI